MNRTLAALAALAALVVLLLGAVPLTAQTIPASPPDSAPTPAVDSAGVDTLFLRAQRMAAEGQGDAARALVQHELDVAAAGSPRYVDALYWRAVVAATAADAERDLRRIIVEFPLSPRDEDALLRLAQLEMTRGDNDQALTHLQRLVIDHPTSPSRARASFWMARVYFDKNQPAAACRSLADAASHTTPAQVEQRNQIDFWMQRCHGVDTSAVAPVSVESSPTAPPPAVTVPAPVPVPAPRARARYTVQVAAYATRAAAESLRASLVKRGFAARVVGTAKPYRVRVGRYDTRAQADAVAKQMKAKQLAVYVTEAEPR